MASELVDIVFLYLPLHVKEERLVDTIKSRLKSTLSHIITASQWTLSFTGSINFPNIPLTLSGCFILTKVYYDHAAWWSSPLIRTDDLLIVISFSSLGLTGQGRGDCHVPVLAHRALNTVWIHINSLKKNNCEIEWSCVCHNNHYISNVKRFPFLLFYPYTFNGALHIFIYPN